jgi:ribosomal protein L11 methyltransferase
MAKTLLDQSNLWLEVSVEVAGIDAELAADLLRQACSGGVSIESASRFDPASDAYVVDGDAPALVHGYLRAGPESARVRRSLRLVLSMAPLERPPRWRRARRLREESWRDAWKKHFGVQRIGRSLVVKPSWTQYRLKGGEVVLEIDPGMAFGTGQHPTTAMCLRALEEIVRPGDAVLDLGCGSGILAIAAARLGATRVKALDVDPNAVKATRENASANGVAHIVEVCEGTLDAEGAAGVFDVIAANISALAVERLAPAFAASLAVGRSIIVSGFLEDAVEAVSCAFISERLKIDRVIEEGVWRAIIADRR